MAGDNGHVELANPPSSLKPQEPDYSELGSAGNTVFGSWIQDDYNPKLFGLRGIQTYDRMRKSDGQVRATMRLVKSPLLSAQWYIEPYSQDQPDLDVAEAVEWALFEGTSRTWIQTLSESLLMLDYGYYVFEKVWKTVRWTPSRAGANVKTLVTWKKFAPRHPRTIAGWNFDANGGIDSIVHRVSNSAGTIDTVIPINKLLIFTHDEEANDPQGISILRSAYKHWYIKEGLYKVDAIQKERHAIGIPYARLPQGFTEKDKTLANEMTRNLRTNEQSRVTIPPMFEVGFLKPEGQLVDVLKSIDHHNHQISNNVLASFLDLGASNSGSRAVGDVQSDIFLKALRYLGDVVRGNFNLFAIPEFCNYNFTGIKGYPKLRVRRIGENVDNRALSVALANLSKSGYISPDTEMEAFLRDVYDLPPMSADAEERTMEDRLSIKQIAEGSNATPPVDATQQPQGGTDVIP